MGNSLQDQFLKMGIVDKKQFANDRKQKHSNKKKGNEPSDISDMAKQALAEKQREAKQHNKKRQAEQEAKEKTARARQLIETHQIAYEGDVAYNFKDHTTVKRIHLSNKAIESLAQGKNGIVKLAGEYKLVPADIIYKIKELNDNMVILFNAPSKKEKNEEDPYADFEVPDDLMW